MKKIRNNRGITLVALIVTIIILLILAGISIASLTGNGLFEKAKLAREKYQNEQEKEEREIAKYSNEIDNQTINSSRNVLSSQVVLYENSEGLYAEGNFNLNMDIDKYNRFTIYCYIGGVLGAGENVIKYFEIYEKGKKFLLDAGFKHVNGYYRDTAIVLQLPTTGKVANLSESAMTQNGGYVSACSIGIYKIVGYVD